MKSQREREIEEAFTRKTGQTIDEQHMSSSRSLGILVGVFLGIAGGAAAYLIFKMLG